MCPFSLGAVEGAVYLLFCKDGGGGGGWVM